MSEYKGTPASRTFSPSEACEVRPIPVPGGDRHLSQAAQHRFGAHVRQHRVQQGLSHADLADLLDLPPALNLADLEAGDGVAQLDLGDAMALAAFCGLTVAQMVGRSPGAGAQS